MRQKSSFFAKNQIPKLTIALWLIGVMFTSGLVSQCSRDIPEIPRAGERAPDFSLKSLTGERVSLKDLTRKGLVLVNFWATWCAPCKAEVPILNQICQKYWSNGLSVVGISVEEPKDVVASFCRRNQVQYTILLDPEGDIAKRYGLIAVPTTVILNQQGIVLFQKSGIINEQMTTALETMLEKTGPTLQTESN